MKEAEINENVFMFFLILVLHFIYQPQLSLPLLLFPPIIFFYCPSLLLIKDKASHWESADLGIIKLRQDQDPPSCINVKKGIPPQ